MTFPSINSFFGGVSAMYVGWRKLIGKCNRLHVAFEAMGALVVQYFWDGFDSAIGKVLVELCKGSLRDLMVSLRIAFEFYS